MSTADSKLYELNTGILQKDAFIIIIKTEWNADIVDQLEAGCISILEKHGMTNYKVITVPGAFEIPYAIKSFWDSCVESLRRPQAFIALGCVIKGSTPHFEMINNAVTSGISQLNLTIPAPSIFGVLTVNDHQQAMERVGGIAGHKGEEAAIAALKMIMMKQSFYNDK